MVAWVGNRAERRRAEREASDLFSQLSDCRLGQEAAANAWTWPRMGKPSEWMEANLILPPGTSAVGGRLSFRARPWWRKVVDTCVEHGRRQILILSGSQTGKSLTIAGLTAYAAKSRPGGVLWMCPTEAMVNDYYRSHIKPIYLASPALRDVLSYGRSDLRGDGATFENGARLILRHAGAKTGAQSTDPWLTVTDEYDKCLEKNPQEGDLGERMLQRILTHRALGRSYNISTPTDEDKGIWALWEKAYQEVWGVRCTHCDQLFPLEFEYEIPETESDRVGGVRWPRLEDGSHPDPDRLLSSGLAYWECPACEHRVDDAGKLRLCQEGDYIRATPDRGLYSSGLRISGLTSPDITWTDAAARFLKALNRPAAMMQFRREVLTQPREIRDHRRSSLRLESLKSSWRSTAKDGVPGPTNLPPIPRGVQRIYFAADAQKVEFWGVLLGMGYEGQAWLLWAGRLESKDDIRKIDLASWEREDGARLWLSMGGIDANDGNRTEELCRLISTLTKFRALRGSRTVKSPISAGRRDFRDPDTGKVSSESIPFYTWQTTYYQDVLQNALDLGPGDGPRAFHLPDDVPREWFEHIRGETRREKVIEGVLRLVWEPVTRDAPNHLRDANAMGYVLADMDDWLYRDEPAALSSDDMKDVLSAFGLD